MTNPSQQGLRRSDLKTPVRNRYFYGKLLDVHHYELEQEYFNHLRRLHNRLIIGPGVVCGLDVKLTDDSKRIVVLPGFALDRCGHEIIVPDPSREVELPPLPPYSSDEGKPQHGARHQSKGERHEYCEADYAHVLICYHECESDPVPTLGGDCESPTPCAAGSIREQYKIEIREGYVPERARTFPDVVSGRRINYPAIVEYVTRGCRPLPDDCCVPLANIRLLDTGSGWEPEVDITPRPIVYNNRLLYELLLSLVKEDEAEAY